MRMFKGMNRWLHNFQRPLSGKNYLPFVDGIRFLAIAPVVILHANERFIRYVYGEELNGGAEQVSYLLSRGAIGVMIFFALSGFVLAIPFAEQAKTFTYKNYLKRRLFRLEPPYLFWMSLFAMVFFLQSGESLMNVLKHWLGSIFYVHNIVYGEFSIINPVAWSLEVEIQYYLIAPFLAMAYYRLDNKKRRRWLLVFCIAFFIVIQHQFGWQFQPIRASLLGQLQHFLVGLLASDFFVNEKKWIQKQRHIYDVLGFIAIIAMMFTWTDDMWKAITFSISLFVFFIATLKGVYFHKLLSIRWVAIIGGMCYTIYLTHLPLLELYYSLIAKVGISSSYLVGLSISLIIAIPLVLFSSMIFYQTIERPFMKQIPLIDFRQKWMLFTTTKSKKAKI